MIQDARELEIALKLVQELVSNNYMLSKAMEEEIPTGEDADGPRFNGYQLLAHLLHAKHEFLTADILEVVFEWVGIGLKQPTATRRQAQSVDDASPSSSSGKTKARASSVGAKSGEQPPKASEREWSNKERRDDRRERRRATGDGRSALGGGVLANPFVFRHVLLELHLWNNSVGMLQLVLQRIASLVSPTNIHHKYNLYRYVLNHSHTHTTAHDRTRPHTRADKNDRNWRAG